MIASTIEHEWVLPLLSMNDCYNWAWMSATTIEHEWLLPLLIIVLSE